MSNHSLRMSWDHFRPYVSFIVVAFFLTFMLISGILEEVKKHDDVQLNFPDFSHYTGGFVQNVSDDLFPIGDSGKRIIAIGDIHGMNSSFTDLLDEVLYDPSRDTLVHLGDLETRATISDSIHVLSFMTSNKILGVRGNNDQKVIEWRAWMDWVLSHTGGSEWLAAMDKQWPDIDGDHHKVELNDWVKAGKYAGWAKMVPEGWRLLGTHYRVARAMSPGHLFFVHAGLLPSNPKLPASDPMQPLSHWPAEDDQGDVAKLRNLQELAVLADIPQNKDPSIVTNIRSVTDNGRASTSSKKGTPWSQLWNDTMAKCSGMDARGQTTLPCYPFTVVYGHAAGRGLDIKRWSVGLDTGCAYGRRLSALVLDEGSTYPSGDETFPRAPHSQQIDFGDDGRASLVSVTCMA